MSTTQPVPAPPRRGFVAGVLRTLAIGGAIIIALLCVFTWRKVGTPGVDPLWLYGAAAAAAVAFLLQLPPLYYRLPSFGRRLATGTLLAAFIIVIAAEIQTDAAWRASPAGRHETADIATSEKRREEEAASEARNAAARQKAEQSLAALDKARQQLADANDRLERCFSSWGHRLPALEDPVKESMHNPAVFEHIETVLTEPDADSNNVVMHFRAENGFGAIRTGQVRAQLIAEDCSVQNIGQPTID